MRINDENLATLPVSEQDLSITFTVELKAGFQRIAPFFTLEEGGEVGCYYAVIRKETICPD